MPALAPTITQTVATDLTPCPSGTKVADLATDPAEVDPGPFTYATADAAFSITAAELFAATDLVGANPVSVTVTGSDATASPATAATITVGEEVVEPPPAEWTSDDGYEDNPAFPPVPADPQEQGWQYFMTMATLSMFPHARDGVDFVNARADKYSDITNVHWNDVLLGPRPDAEIETLARALAAEAPALNP
jgi:hypothetical protein